MAQAVKQNNIQVSEGVKFLKYTYVASVVTLFVIQIYSMLTGSSIVGTLQVNGENVLYKSFTIISLICAVYCLVFKSVCYAKSGCPCCLFKTLSFSFMSICYSLYVVYFFDTVINANAADLLYQVLWVFDYIIMAMLVMLVADLSISLVKNFIRVAKEGNN